MATRAPSSHSREDIVEALQAVALNQGSTTAARKELKRRGHDISTSTLAKWKRDHRDIYATCEANITDEHLARYKLLLHKQVDFELDVIDSLHDDLREGKLGPSEKIAAARNVAQAKSVNVEKVINPLEGRPTVITEHREPSQLLAEMARYAAMAQAPRQADVDSTAVEQPAIGGGE